MKTVFRVAILVLIACVIYFATIGRDDFYHLLDTAEGLIQLIAPNYLKK